MVGYPDRTLEQQSQLKGVVREKRGYGKLRD